MNPRRHHSSMSIIDQLRFNLPTCNAEFDDGSSVDLERIDLLIRSSIDDSEVLRFRGRMPQTDREVQDLVRAVCSKVESLLI